jgi:ubiquinone/menaquinone biosynthesis C-methylase UbiE/predicted transcriptional regulator
MENKQRHEISPEQIVLDTFAFCRTRVLSTAVDLEIFTHISQGKKTAQKLSQAAGTNTRGLEMVLDTLCSMGYLYKKNGAYELTPQSRFFLVKGKKMYYGEYVKHVDLSWEPWFKLTEVLKTGKPSLPSGTEQEGGFNYYKELVPLLFRTTHLVAAGGAKALGIGAELKGLKIMDVGTGSGAWGIALAQADPTCQIYGVDDAIVLQQTKRHAEQMGVINQFHFLPTNVEEDPLGDNEYDMATLSYVCHGEGARKSKIIISKIYKALKTGGRLVICELCPDEEREKDFFTLVFGVNMLIHTTEGNTFTISEYSSWLKEAGFKNVATIDIPATSPLIVGTK